MNDFELMRQRLEYWRRRNPAKRSTPMKGTPAKGSAPRATAPRGGWLGADGYWRFGIDRRRYKFDGRFYNLVD